MKPSDKSPEMQSALDAFTYTQYGITRTEAITKNICVSCKHPASEFRDPLSAKEFSISGLCQRCQDSLFGGEDR